MCLRERKKQITVVFVLVMLQSFKTVSMAWSSNPEHLKGWNKVTFRCKFQNYQCKIVCWFDWEVWGPFVVC